MANRLLSLVVVCGALLLAVRTVSAEPAQDLVVVDMPAHGVLRILPENRGVVYVGTGDAIDTFSFAAADDSGCSWTEVDVDLAQLFVGITCEDGGGPIPTGLNLYQLLGKDDDPGQPAEPIEPGEPAPDGEAQNGCALIILVDQPGEGGDRDTWEGPFFNPDVGHAFIEIIDGATGESRRFGFYPGDNVSPLDPTCPGTVQDDSDRPWDVKYRIEITPDQYQELIDEINEDIENPPVYDLNDNNCTDWVLDLIEGTDFKLDASTGDWPNGGGHNPGDLGEDLIDNGGERNDGSADDDSSKK